MQGLFESGLLGMALGIPIAVVLLLWASKSKNRRR